MLKFLHPASGNDANTYTTQWFADRKHWQEVRMNPVPSPFTDVVGDLKSLHKIPENSFDAVYLNRHIERLYPHEVQTALKELHRILKDDGHLVMNCTDLQAISRIIAEGQYLEPVYKSAHGEVAPIDLIYGFRPALKAGRTENAIHCTFTAKSLGTTLSNIGFEAIWLRRHPEFLTFLTIASKSFMNKKQIEDLSAKHFPIRHTEPEKKRVAVHKVTAKPAERSSPQTQEPHVPPTAPAVKKVSAKTKISSSKKSSAQTTAPANTKKKSSVATKEKGMASKKTQEQKTTEKKKK